MKRLLILTLLLLGLCAPVAFAAAPTWNQAKAAVWADAHRESSRARVLRCHDKGTKLVCEAQMHVWEQVGNGPWTLVGTDCWGIDARWHRDGHLKVWDDWTAFGNCTITLRV